MGKAKAVAEEDADAVVADAPEKKAKKSKKEKGGEEGDAAAAKEPKSKRKDKAEGEEKPSKKAKKAAEPEGEAAEAAPPKKKASKAAKEAAPAEAAEPPAADDPNSLDNFELSPAVRAKLRESGIGALFPIQAATFKIVMDGNDLVGRARTGQARRQACVRAREPPR